MLLGRPGLAGGGVVAGPPLASAAHVGLGTPPALSVASSCPGCRVCEHRGAGRLPLCEGARLRVALRSRRALPVPPQGRAL